jgi:hypothetical protein
MRTAVAILLVGGVLPIGACGGGEDGETESDPTSTTGPRAMRRS